MKRTLIVLENNDIMVTQNISMQTKDGIKQVIDVSYMSDAEFEDLMMHRMRYKPVRDKQGKVTALQHGSKRLSLKKD